MTRCWRGSTDILRPAAVMVCGCWLSMVPRPACPDSGCGGDVRTGPGRLRCSAGTFLRVLSARVRSHRSPGPRGQAERSGGHVRNLAGNVWEWCLNKHEKPEVIEADTSGDWRVVRGGSWIHDPEGARSALRLGDPPYGRNVNQGFRVLCAAPIRSEH